MSIRIRRSTLYVAYCMLHIVCYIFVYLEVHPMVEGLGATQLGVIERLHAVGQTVG